ADPLWLRRLVMYLAEEWVPGLRMQRRKAGVRGRPRTKGKPEARAARAELLELVEGHCSADPRVSATAYCATLATKHFRKLPLYYRERRRLSGRTLRADLAIARDERLETRRYTELTRNLGIDNARVGFGGWLSQPDGRGSGGLLRSSSDSPT